MISDAPARRRARQRRTSPDRPRPAAPVRPQEPAKSDAVKSWVGGTLLIAWIGLFYVADDIAGAYVDLTRWLTGGRSWAMAAAGWLGVFAIFAVIWAFVLIGKRLTERQTYLLGAIGLALVPITLTLIPGTADFDLVELVTGVGGTDFILGARNGGLGGIVPLAVVPFLAFNNKVRAAVGAERLRRALTVAVAAFVVVTLLYAMVRAGG